MSDPNPASRITLGAALRALPPASPPHDAWPALAAQLQRAPATRRRRYVVPLAIAAACACAFVATRLPHSPVPSATVAHPSASYSANGAATTSIHNVENATNTAQLAQLQQRSHALERWLRETGRDAAPLQGQDLAAAAEIENLIGLVDVELAAPQRTRASALWQRRVGLLEDLAALRYSNYRLAAGGRLTMFTQVD
ncbi:MAG: hypothetical protein ACREPN_00320 [Rudaea sp.]